MPLSHFHVRHSRSPAPTQTLISEDAKAGNGVKRRRSSSNSSFHPVEKGKHRAVRELEARDSSSPAPTSLPWFAEDLSPEDLALVHRTGGRTSTSSSTRDVDGGGGGGDGEGRVGDDEARKKQVILGGLDLSKERQEPGTYVAIDCEMVGVGPDGSESILARVSLVNWHGAVLMDSFVRPKEKVTDYRTWVSGVRPADLQGAPTFQEVQSQVAQLIEGRVLVGHAIHNDLKALLLSHPKPLIRDTAQNKVCRELANTKYPSLKKLVALKLGIEIQKQGAEHSPVEDARATMALYRTLHPDWQKSLSISGSIIGKGWKSRDKKRKEHGEERSSPAKSARTSGDSLASQDPNWWKHV